MKILSHYALDMNQKTKISTKFPRSKVGVATAVLSLGGVLVYSVGMINPLYASQRTNLEVNGVQNRVQYLNTLIVTGGTNGVKLQYDKDSTSVQALGSLNMQNLVVGKGNSSSTSSVVFGGTNNANNGENSFIAWGEEVRVDSSAQNVAVISSQGANVNASNTLVMHGNNINTSQGSNIMVLNAEDKTINGNYVTVLGNSSASADRTFVLGDNVENRKSNTFVFNGKDGAFVPDQDSAFYANSKVAINADNAKAQLDVNGGAMIGIREDLSVPKWNYKGTIARFVRDGELGLCALDGKNNQRIPLSESARKFWLCTETHFVELPRNAVTNDTNRYLPGVWNQQTGRWQKGLWVYGSKNKKGHFLCADGFVPDNSDPIGKTGVECIACEWAKSGDLNCGEKKKVEETTPTCPQGTTYNKTANKCEGSRETTCMVFPGKQGTYTPNKTIEEFDGTKWVVKQKCQLTCDSGYVKKTDSATQTEYCEKTGKTLRVRFMYPNKWQNTEYFRGMQLDLRNNLRAPGNNPRPSGNIPRPSGNNPRPPERSAAKGILKTATEAFEIAVWTQDEVRVNVWDPYLELTMPFTRTSDSLDYSLAVGEVLGEYHAREETRLYNLTKTSSRIIPRARPVYLRLRWCNTEVAKCKNSHGETAYIQGSLPKDEVGDADLIDLVYYMGAPINSTQWPIPMKFIQHTHAPSGNECKGVAVGAYQVCLTENWKREFWISKWPIYSNVRDNFFDMHNPRDSRHMSIYIKESMSFWSAQKDLYFYTDAGFTQKAPRWYYYLNAEYAGFASAYPDLYASGVKGVYVDETGKVKTWVWEKPFEVVYGKYYF